MTLRRISLFVVLFLLMGLDSFALPGASPGGQALNLSKFVDQLPIPPSIQLRGRRPFELTITLGQFEAKLHRDLPPQPEWGYDGSSPGPTIQIERGRKLTVHWKNQLPEVHLFQAPKGADRITPDVRAITHLHGAVVTEPDPMDRLHNNDGWPDAWNIPGQEQIAEYPNDQAARTLWYHDHAMGETGRNVAAGLLGLYEIHDRYERSLNLPSGRYDIPLAIQARGVNADGSLYYTADIANEFYGNALAVNGKLWPFLNVEPRKYRFRIVNVSNARSYALSLAEADDGATSSGNAGPAFYQIGTGSGFLQDTVILNDPSDPASPKLVLAPAERADVIIDFSGVAGRSFVLKNSSHDPGTSALPLHLRPIPRLRVADAAGARQIIFGQMAMPDGTLMQTLNGRSWKDPIEDRPVLGTTEVWELANTLTDVHPFHIHGLQFQVLDRTFFDVQAFLATGKINYLAPPVPPLANEMGWKDTVRVLPQMVTRIILKFSPFPGYYVYHCHILEHEDMDMMRPFEIVPPGTLELTPR